MFSRFLSRTAAVALLGAGVVIAGASPAFATNPTNVVTSDISAGSDAVVVGQATFTRTLNDDGTTTVQVVGNVPGGIKESELCYTDAGPYTSRVSPGQCQLSQGKTGTSVTYTVGFPASDASKSLYFQFHIDNGDTAFAGWHDGNPFYGNVEVQPAESGTSVPVGTVGGLGLAGVMGIGLVLALRRRTSVPSAA